MKTTFFGVSQFADKASALQAMVRDPASVGTTVFEIEPRLFSVIPSAPFAYWVDDATLAAFGRIPPFTSEGREARQGASSTSGFRYIRLWTEVPYATVATTFAEAQRGSATWVPFAKGGEFARYHSDIHLLMKWRDDGREVKEEIARWRETKGWGYSWSATLNGYTNYGRPGVTWTSRTTSELSARAMPQGCIFADKGPAAFEVGDGVSELLSLLSILNSAPFRALLSVQIAAVDAAARSYEVGAIQRTPIPSLSQESTNALALLARRAWSLKRSLNTADETSHVFLLPVGLNERVTGLCRGTAERELEAIEALIDEAAFQLYELTPESCAVLDASSSGGADNDNESEEPGDDEDEDPIEDEATAGREMDSVTSWLVGICFGRFDPRLATGERVIPPEPEPFEPLPARSPGMYIKGEEPADRPHILVDDEGHLDDLTLRARAVAERVKVDAPENLRGWLAKEFFPLHIKMYSKSRRKAPIYWQLATPSASYSVWLYIHAFSNDTLFRVQTEYVAPKLAHEERRLDSMMREKAPTKEVTAQHAFVEELRAFLEEVKRVAPLWKPNLDDGVIINFAPLWRLVPQNKSWQKELKSTWDALCEGNYHWAHLSMHLWPERVVPKCAKDRSLAIAHGLEDMFWVQGSDGKWTARSTSTRSIEDLVRERTSPAVKSALKSLLEAPMATGNSTRRKSANRKMGSAAAAEGE